MGMTKASQIQDRLQGFLDAVRMEKQAEDVVDKTTTSHPVAQADTQCQKATEGERSAENTADVKADTPSSVDAASAATEGLPTEPDIGMKARETGEDPENETSGASGTGAPDPGTSHPADAQFGDKYGSYSDPDLAKLAQLADSIMARFSVLDSGVEKSSTDESTVTGAETASPAPDAASAVKKDEPAEGDDPAKMDEVSKDAAKTGKDMDKAKGLEEKRGELDSDVAAGYQAGAQVTSQLLQKNAEAEQYVVSLVKQAQEDAELLAGFYQGLVEGHEKKAQPGMPDEAALAAAGAPEEAMPPMPPMPAGGEEGGAPGDEELTPEEEEALMQALQEAGVTPEEFAQLDPAMLEQALQEAMAAEGSGVPPVEEAPPEVPPEVGAEMPPVA